MESRSSIAANTCGSMNSRQTAPGCGLSRCSTRTPHPLASGPPPAKEEPRDSFPARLVTIVSIVACLSLAAAASAVATDRVPVQSVDDTSLTAVRHTPTVGLDAIAVRIGVDLHLPSPCHST